MMMGDIEQAIDEELRNLNLDPSEYYSEDDNFTELDESLQVEEQPSASVLAYIEASKNRMNAFEQLILEDVEKEDMSSQELHINHNDNRINERAMDFIEDPKKWKERVICEIEQHVESHITQSEVSNIYTDVETDHDIESEMQFSLEWRELENKLKEEEEQKLAAQEVERELLLISEREDEERRRRSLMEFEEQLRKVEEATLFHNVGAKKEVLYTMDLQLELDKQQEFIRKLEKELEEEKQAFEEAQEKERKRTQELHCRAATTIQAAVRGTLVRRWSMTELKRKREEEKRLEEEKKELEKIKKKREEDKRKIDEEKRIHREEIERRRTDYETAKEHERHRLEKEKRLEQQRKKEEEDEERRGEMERKEEQNNLMFVEERRVNEESQCLEKEKRLEQQRKKEEEDEERRREMERKEEQNNFTSVGEKEEEDEERRREMERKEGQNNFTCVGEKRVKNESRRQEEDVEKGNKEKERRQQVRSNRADEECKRKEKNEERGEKEIKGNEEEVRERKDNMERIRDGNKEKNVLKKQRNTMERIDKSINVKRLDYHKLQTIKNKDRMKSCQEEKQFDGNGEPDSLKYLLQSRNNLNVAITTPDSHINEHQELSNDYCINLFGSPNISGHLCSDVTQDTDTDKSLKGVKPEMDTRGHQTATAIELEICGPGIQESSSICLPDSTEQKRLAWMKNCTPWSKLSLQNKKKGASAQQQSQKRVAKRTRVPNLPPLSMDTILQTGAWSSLEQVTTVTLEDLPGCNLSTLSQCYKLQTITLRRCGLRSLDGLKQCSQIRYIDVQENSITHVDCGGLANLQVLLLCRNQLTNIHGLDDAKNLQVIQLSYNSISHISGLGSLKMLLRLSVDHNQLLSTRGLNEIYTLMHLDCSYNHLSHVEGLENCALLNMLDLRGNSLTELPVLHNHVLLRDLSLDDNLISSVRDLESYWLPLLQNLSIAHNSITELIPLLDLVSLKMLDVSQNCLSDLQNVCLNLQKCTGLQELNLTDNPLQQKKNWRSLLLETVPGLIKLNNEQTSATSAPPKGPRQRWSFQALCQAQQGQRDSLLQRHKMEISSAPSQHDAQLLASDHHAELFRLAVDQRYAHEYGDSCVTEDPVTSASADTSQHDFSEVCPSPKQSPKNTADPQKAHLELQPNDPQTDFPGSCAEKRTEKEPVQKLNLKIAAAVVIQRCWRRYVLQRRGGLSGLIAKTNESLNIRRTEDSCVERPEPPRSDCAAVVIQAAWRGYNLRKRLACALASAQITESDEDFEEVDMDEFIFDEKAMEKDWITLHSDASPAGAMPYTARPPLPKSLMPPKTPSIFPWQPKHAWSDSEGAVCLEQNVSPHLSSRMNTLSVRSEEILKEWGITSDSTAHLMLKRANKMKGRKQQQKRLLEAQRGTRPKFKDCFKVRQAENEVLNAQRAEESQNYKEKTYQWLHKQAVYPHIDDAVLGQDHFLPVIDRDILNGGRVQLVAGAGGRDGVDSGAKFWVDSTGVSPPLNKQTQARRHSIELTKTGVPLPNRVSSAPSRKERISYRDSPVRHSGGWGGGKKRTKLNK